MDTELILSAHTYRQGIAQLNDALSGTAYFNGFSTNFYHAVALYTIQDSDYTVFQNIPANISLPAATNRGRMLVIKNISGLSINIVPDAGDTVEAASPYILLNNQTITIQSAGGSTWYIISKIP